MVRRKDAEVEKAFAEQRQLRAINDATATAWARRLYPNTTIAEISRLVRRDHTTVRLWVTGIAIPPTAPPKAGETWRRLLPTEERVTVESITGKMRKGSVILLRHSDGQCEFIDLSTMMETMERVP